MNRREIPVADVNHAGQKPNEASRAKRLCVTHKAASWYARCLVMFCVCRIIKNAHVLQLCRACAKGKKSQALARSPCVFAERSFTQLVPELELKQGVPPM